MIKFSIFIFYIFVHNKFFLKIFPNFNLLRTLELTFFRPLFPTLPPFPQKYHTFYTNCDYNFNPCAIFEKMMSFTQILNQDLEQGKLMAAVTTRK